MEAYDGSKNSILPEKNRRYDAVEQPAGVNEL